MPGSAKTAARHSQYVLILERGHKGHVIFNRCPREQVKSAPRLYKIVSKGSSLKLCMIAEGEADIYPRFAPTSEWDTAAGHAIVSASGGKIVLAKDETKELQYNKEDILNPWFIAKR